LLARPEATDPALTEEVFHLRLRRHTGEIKASSPTRSSSRHRNAYADEICWRAQLYPFAGAPASTIES